MMRTMTKYILVTLVFLLSFGFFGCATSKTIQYDDISFTVPAGSTEEQQNNSGDIDTFAVKVNDNLIVNIAKGTNIGDIDMAVATCNLYGTSVNVEDVEFIDMPQAKSNSAMEWNVTNRNGVSGKLLVFQYRNNSYSVAILADKNDNEALAEVDTILESVKIDG